MSPPADPNGPVRWRASAIAFEAAGAFLLLLAFLLRSPVPLFAGLPLLVAPLAAATIGVPAIPPGEVVWWIEGEGAQVHLEGRVDFGPGGPPPGVEVRLTPPSEFAPEGPVEHTQVGPTLAFRGRWRVREPTLAVLDPPTLVWSDPLGFVERAVTARGPGLPVERYPPDLHRLRAMRLERVRPVPGETRSHRRGSQGEFFGLRPAGPDEPIRRINWRASARAGRWLVNEFELDLTGDLLIVLDVRPTPVGPELDDRLLSVGRAVCLGVAKAFLREKSRVGFAAFGEFVGPTVPLSTGRVQGLRIREAVVHSLRSAVAGPGERCAFGLGRFFPRGVTTLVVSAATGDPLLELPPYLRRRGWPVVLLSPSPLAFRTGGTRLDAEREQLAQRLEHLERRDRLAALWSYGPVVDWDDLWSLQGLAFVFRQPPRRRVT